MDSKIGKYKVSYKYKDNMDELYQAFDETYKITQEDINKSFDKEDTPLESLLRSIIEEDMSDTISVGQFYSIKPLQDKIWLLGEQMLYQQILKIILKSKKVMVKKDEYALDVKFADLKDLFNTFDS